MPELVEAIRAANLTGKPQRIEFSARLPAPRWSEAFVAPVALGGHGPGRAGVVVVTVHDLTPIRRADGMRADFVANVSHELRTPLAASPGSSTRCRARRATIRPRATGSSASCRRRPGAWRG